MAKKPIADEPQQPAAPAPAAEETTAVATRAASPTALAASLTNESSWMAKEEETFESSGIGTEGIGMDDVRLPRLAVAQGLSPQIAGEEPVEGLKLYDLFNDLTNEIYGRGPIHFVPCLRDVRYIEFKPRSEGGGVLDLNVPANDARTQWTKDPESKERVPPKATKFVEFVILLLRPDRKPETVVLSIKDTNKHNRTAHMALSSFISLRNDDIFGGIYTVSSHPERNDSGIYGVYKIQNAGRASGAIRALGKAVHDSLKGKKIVVDRGINDEEDSAGQGGPAGEEIPF